MINQVTMRTIKTFVVFTRPFLLSGMDAAQPAGTYGVETDEELLQVLSFPAYHRVATRLFLAPDPRRPGIVEEIIIDPAELAAALAADLAAPTAPA